MTMSLSQSGLSLKQNNRSHTRLVFLFKPLLWGKRSDITTVMSGLSHAGNGTLQYYTCSTTHWHVSPTDPRAHMPYCRGSRLVHAWFTREIKDGKKRGGGAKGSLRRGKNDKMNGMRENWNFFPKEDRTLVIMYFTALHLTSREVRTGMNPNVDYSSNVFLQKIYLLLSISISWWKRKAPALFNSPFQT